MNRDTTDTPFDGSTGPECDFVRENADAFALGALTDSEVLRVSSHMAGHAACARVVNQSRLTAATLAWSVPLVAEPDQAVRLQLFDRIAREQGHAPTVTPTRIERGTALVAALQSAPAAAVAPAQAVSRRTAAWVTYLGGAMVAPLAIALVVVSLWAYNMNDELDHMQAQLDAATGAPISGTSIEMMSMESSDSAAGGSLGAMPNQTSAVLLAWDLDPEEEHQVWCEESDGQKWMVSALDVSDSGEAMQTITFPKPIDGYKRIFVAGSDDQESEAPELILTIPEKRTEDDHVRPTATP